MGFDLNGLGDSFSDSLPIVSSTSQKLDSRPGASLTQLGILEHDKLDDDQKFPVIKGDGALKETLAVIQMTALYENVPFKRDVVEKVLEDQFRRNKSLSLELLARLCEIIGLNCQIAAVENQYVSSIEVPVVMMLQGVQYYL